MQGNGKKRRLSRIKKDSNSLTFPCTGLEAVIIGEIHENITLHCGNISGPRGLVTWCRNDSESVFLLSSSSSLPPAQSRFSLVNASALHIEALNLQDEGNYTCSEVLNKTETRRFQVWLQVASKWWVGIATSGEVLRALDLRRPLESVAWLSFWALARASSHICHFLICIMGIIGILAS